MSAQPPKAALVEASPATVTDVLAWLEGRAGGVMSIDAARVRRAAIMCLLGSIDPTTSIDSVHVDVAATRWLEREPGRTLVTARTYASRVQHAFREYREYQGNPLAWQPKPKRGRRPRLPVHRRNLDVRELRFIPLANGAEFAFLPPAAFSMRDVDRIAQHLRTLTHDWQPNDAPEGAS